MTVAAVDRCLTLIEVLAGEIEPLEVSVLAGRVDLPISAAHRILATLVERGWVVQDPASQQYALSLRLSTLAFRHLDNGAVPNIVQSVLERLALATREYCRLAIVTGRDLVWVARAQGATTGLRYDPDMGRGIVLHATANGKAWLSTLPENDALDIVRERGFDALGPLGPLGPRSVRSIAALRRHLRSTRARGYATSVDEGEEGTAALAVPFRADSTADAPVAGTISVAGPLLRMTPERYPELHEQLTLAATDLADVWPLRTRQRGVAARWAAS